MKMGLLKKDGIDLKIQTNKYSPGDTISGNIELNLKKPVKGRKLEIKLKGIRKDRVQPGNLSAVTGGNKAKGSHTTKVYDNKITVSENKDYQIESYPFELKIPNDIFDLAKLPIGDVDKKSEGLMKSIYMVSSHNTTIEWYLIAQIDVPFGRDIKKKQQIEISN